MHIKSYDASHCLLRALDRIALTCMKQELPDILKQEYGDDWVNDFIRPLIQRSHFYEYLFFPEHDPFSLFDFSAMWYLLFPYEMTDTGKRNEPAGAGEILRDTKCLTDLQYSRLRSLRTLRSFINVDQPDIRFIKPEHLSFFFEEGQKHMVPSGKTFTSYTLACRGIDPEEAKIILHMDIIDYIAEAIQPLDPSAKDKAETEKRNTLNKLLQKNIKRC